MLDDHLTLTVERLRDDLGELMKQLRKKYKTAARQVVADEIKAHAARLAESWMVDIAPRQEVQEVLSADVLGDLNVRFQRLLTFSEHATKRSRYDAEIRAILKRYSLDVVIPLKQAVAAGPRQLPEARQSSLKVAGSGDFTPTAFVGHSFASTDSYVNEAIINCLQNLGIAVETGKKPKADKISDKVKRLIDKQCIFVGVFSRRDKIARKPEWTTSPWVIDEKAYAVGVSKRLILLKEAGVGSIGGIQGDYEYIEFSRDGLHDLIAKLMQLFNISVNGFQK